MIPELKSIDEIDPFKTFHAVKIKNDLYIPGSNLFPVSKYSRILEVGDYSTRNVRDFLTSSVLKISRFNLDPNCCIDNNFYVYKYNYFKKVTEKVNDTIIKEYISPEGISVRTCDFDLENINRFVRISLYPHMKLFFVFIGDRFYLLPVKHFKIFFYTQFELFDVNNNNFEKTKLKRVLLNKSEHRLLSKARDSNSKDLDRRLKKITEGCNCFRNKLLGIYIKDFFGKKKIPIFQKVLTKPENFVVWKKLNPLRDPYRGIFTIRVSRDKNGINSFGFSNAYKESSLTKITCILSFDNRSTLNSVYCDVTESIEFRKYIHIKVSDVPILVKEDHLETILKDDTVIKFIKKSKKVY